jgi:hypothetical protein
MIPLSSPRLQEVANRSTIREQQRKEVARLKATLDNLLTHQRFVDESITSYQDYLKACKERQYMVLATKSVFLSFSSFHHPHKRENSRSPPPSCKRQQEAKADVRKVQEARQ